MIRLTIKVFIELDLMDGVQLGLLANYYKYFYDFVYLGAGLLRVFTQRVV